MARFTVTSSLIIASVLITPLPTRADDSATTTAPTLQPTTDAAATAATASQAAAPESPAPASGPAAATQARLEGYKRLEKHADSMKAEGAAIGKTVYAAAGGNTLSHIAKIEFDATVGDPALAGAQSFHHIWNVQSNTFSSDSPILHNNRLDKKIVDRLKNRQSIAAELFVLSLQLNRKDTVVRQLPGSTPGGPSIGNPIDETFAPSVIQEEVTLPRGVHYVLGVDGNTRHILWSYPIKDGQPESGVLVWRDYQQIGPVNLSVVRFHPDHTPAITYSNFVITPNRSSSTSQSTTSP